jgi:hypothetical protein
MNPVEKILGGQKEYAEKKNKQFGERVKEVKENLNTKGKLLHEKQEKKGEELEEKAKGLKWGKGKY